MEPASPKISTGSKLPYLDDKFDEFFQQLMKEWRVPGASLAVVDEHSIQTKAYGMARWDDTKVTEDTLFNAASMSKSFTAAAAALLVDDPKYPEVQWDTKASSLLREDFVLSDPYYTENVTIMDMLSHRTGLDRHDDVCFGINAQCPSTPESITRSLRHLPIAEPIRTKFQYNNLMFMAASYLTETVAKTPFPDILKDRFWDPLGMKDTFLALGQALEPEQKDRLASGYWWNSEEEKFVELPDFSAPEGQGAGNIVSSARDWARWVHAMIHGTTGLSSESYEEMVRPHILAGDQPEDAVPFQSAWFYGLGLNVEWYRGTKLVNHPGGIPGFTAYQFWLPDKKWGCVMFGNAEGLAYVSEVVSWWLIDEVLGVPEPERTDFAKLVRERKAADDQKSAEEQAKNVFPDRPDVPLPSPLPLSAYAGCYEHPAYRDLTLEIKDEQQLFADASDRTFGFTLRFEHLSGCYFVVVRQDSPKSSDNVVKLEAEFEIGASGKVQRLGLDLQGDRHDGGDYVWFDRTD